MYQAVHARNQSKRQLPGFCEGSRLIIPENKTSGSIIFEEPNAAVALEEHDSIELHQPPPCERKNQDKSIKRGRNLTIQNHQISKIMTLDE